jgi:ABC-type glycerol-3-phosphate transport system substrate-binding protein
MKKLLLLWGTILMLCSCSLGEESESASGEAISLTLVSFEESRELTEQVDMFNEAHEGYRIDIQIYGQDDADRDDRIERLQREIAAGRGPDIVNYGTHYATNYCLGHYTENLLDYLSDDWQSVYFSNILESFFLDGGLYAMPVGFSLSTFVGRQDMLGDRERWSVQEMVQVYMEREEGVILYPGETKADVFWRIFSHNMEYFIDWEKGRCSFDSEEFRDILEFSNTFPDMLRITEDYSPKTLFAEGKTLLYPVSISGIYDICRAGRILATEEVAYVGFPVGEGYGTVIRPSSLVLAISAASEHKDISWEFIAQFLAPDYQAEKLNRCLPLRRGSLENMLEEAGSMDYAVDEDGNAMPVAKAEILFDGEGSIEVYYMEEKEKEQLLRLIDTASLNDAIDYTLYYTLQEEAQSYFAGDKTLDEAVDVIQRRASLYVAERM